MASPCGRLPDGLDDAWAGWLGRFRDTGAGTPRRPLPTRRRRVLIGLTVGVVVLAALAVAAGRGLFGPESRTPSLGASSRDGTVVATGRDFPRSTFVDVVARLEGGSGSAQVETDDVGAFTIIFRPPAGFTGVVDVSAAVGDRRATASTPTSATVSDAPSPTDGGNLASGVRGNPPVVPTTGAPVSPPPPPDPGLPRFDVPTTIPADCSADVTEQLNDWMAAVPDGSLIEFGDKACYRVEGSVTLVSRNDLVLEGNGATLRATTRVPTPETNRGQLRLDYGSDITVRDLSLVGVNPKAEFSLANQFDHNLFIRGTHGVVVTNVHGRNAYGDFIAIAHGMDGTTIPGNITISDVSADTVGRMGISCVACDGVSVENSVFNNIAYHVFDLEIEGDNWPGRNVRYTNNVVEAHGWAFFSVGTPFQTENNDLSNVYIAGNAVTQPGSDERTVPARGQLPGQQDRRPDGGHRGQLLGSRTDGIMVKRASDVRVSNNTAVLVGPVCGTPVGIRTISVRRGHLDGNEMRGYSVPHEKD